ncbi:hypothetical protein WN944_008925 [Citrus x changshan-huyou]|uniref:Uncharacterized protein n=1 Tax=Citrus x changshan-huyou TaxID=2935761 RepID=A0AAP0QRM8_9ROSI
MHSDIPPSSDKRHPSQAASDKINVPSQDGAAGGQGMVSMIIADPVAKDRGVGRVSIGQSTSTLPLTLSSRKRSASPLILTIAYFESRKQHPNKPCRQPSTMLSTADPT